MPKTKYVDFYGITELQREVMLIIDKWARENKKPIGQKEIITGMNEKGVKSYTTINAINSLLKKGYIRRAVITSNKSFYVQLRKLSY